MKIKLNSQNSYNNIAQKIAENLAGSWNFDGNRTVTFDKVELEEFTEFDIHHIRLNNGLDWFIVRHQSPSETFLTIKHNGNMKRVYFLIEVIDKEFYPKSEVEEEYALEDLIKSIVKRCRKLLPLAIENIVKIAKDIDIEVK